MTLNAELVRPAVFSFHQPEAFVDGIMKCRATDRGESRGIQLCSKTLVVPHPEVSAVSQVATHETTNGPVAMSLAKQRVAHEPDCRGRAVIGVVCRDEMTKVGEHAPKHAPVLHCSTNIAKRLAQVLEAQVFEHMRTVHELRRRVRDGKAVNDVTVTHIAGIPTVRPGRHPSAYERNPLQAEGRAAVVVRPFDGRTTPAAEMNPVATRCRHAKEVQNGFARAGNQKPLGNPVG